MENQTNHKIELWRGHVTGAENHPESVTAYCKENGLSPSSYYQWRKLVKGADGNTDKKLRPKKAKKVLSPFLPVEVEPALVRSRVDSGIGCLPEARWAAEVMLYLMRGLS
mgnify:CR=1 FL=1